MDIQHNHMKLTASEVSFLWRTYIADSMSICVFTYLLSFIEDSDVKHVVQHAIDLSQQHIDIIHGIFTDEKIPIPDGFSIEKDVNPNAKRLFSDPFCLHYLKMMSKGGLSVYSNVIPNIYREDILSFFSKALKSTVQLNDEVTEILLKKGIQVRPPTIPYPQKVEYVHKQSFLLEGLNKRPLNGIEITNLYSNIQTNQLGAALATAFSQVVKSKKIRNYILRGKDISIKHVKIFSDYLAQQSLPVPVSLEQEITDSPESPFSDKLILFHFSLMNYSGIGNYGMAISESLRSDLAIDFSRLLAEVLKFGEDGINLMIAFEWLEQGPLAVDREEIQRHKE
ncbi:hypothetical protein GCM10008967_31670 [Bacillus carboniphilus]|uniref:DUF3231 family protein n=1 Tax=Bacillus carboniphilus TaxID=86663 RepID=A0ABN0WIK6_9BACI